MNGGKNPGKSSTMKEKKTSIVVVFACITRVKREK
jgi:hypothetical protein